MNRRQLFDLISHVNNYNIECDGATRIIRAVLYRAGVTHDVYMGNVQNTTPDAAVVFCPLHFWIMVGDFMIDLRAIQWFGDERAPHGVFYPREFPAYIYQGVPCEMRIDVCNAMEIIAKADLAGEFKEAERLLAERFAKLTE